MLRLVPRIEGLAICNFSDLWICEDCKAPYADEFKKVACLKNSGLQIFIHKEKQASRTVERGSNKKEETFVLHNAGEKELKRADYITEMCQYRTKCFQCKTVIQRVRSLLDEITDIKKNQVLGICEHCKRANPSGKCRRCEFIVNKFLCNKVKQYEDKQNRFKAWICKVNQLLHNILESENVCKHKLEKEFSTLELEKLLQELKSPLEMRQPDITFFPIESGPLGSMTQSKEMLEELLNKLKFASMKRRSNDSMFVSPSIAETSCVCKYFMNQKYEGKPSIEMLPEEAQALIGSKPDSKTRHFVSRESTQQIGTDINEGKALSKDKNVKETPSKEKAKLKLFKDKPGKENDSPEKEPKEKKSKEGKAPKAKLSPEEEMMLKMMKERKHEKLNKEKSAPKDKVKKFAKVESLPKLKVRKHIEVVEEKSESVVECGQEDVLPAEMIKGARVVPFDQRYKDKVCEPNAPHLYKIEAVCSEPKIVKPPTISTTPTTTDKGIKLKSKNVQEEASTKGVIKYALSNREFIEKGWTILPTTKIMRRINIYKMKPANPKYDWFKRHKNRKMMFYDTCEKLAEIDDYGRGKWFYKNGRIALDYYNAQELNSGQRYVVYSSGEEMENGKNKPVTVLASFDFLGNGVVYDCFGNIRIKYNQTEGIVIDEKIGAPGRWKWHSLNEPPVLQPVFIDSYDKNRNSCMDDMLKSQKDDRSETMSKQDKTANDEMLAIEFENFVKEKEHKLLQKFKPFQIRMKVMKVNDQFSLRILDQTNVYLLFRDGQISLKLNLGMHLDSSEIVDTETAEVSEVATPYDRFPPKTPSVAEIQSALKNAKRISKTRSTNVISEKKSIESKSFI